MLVKYHTVIIIIDDCLNLKIDFVRFVKCYGILNMILNLFKFKPLCNNFDSKLFTSNIKKNQFNTHKFKHNS